MFSRPCLHVFFLLLLASCLVAGCQSAGNSAASSNDLGPGIDQTTPRPDTIRVQLFLGASTVPPGHAVRVAAFVTRNGVPAETGTVQFLNDGGGDLENPTGEVSQGWFATRFVAGSIPMTAHVSAMMEGISTSAVLLVSPLPVTPKVLSLKCVPDTVYSGQSTLVVVQVTDASGTPANGDIQFSCSLPGTFNAPSSTVTDGFCSNVFTPGTSDGVATISALCLGASGQASLLIRKLTQTVTITLGQAVVAANSRGNPVTVMCADSLGRPVSQVPVILSCPGVTFDSPTGQTDANGYFATTFTAGGDSGTRTIIAQVGDVVSSASVTIDED